MSVQRRLVSLFLLVVMQACDAGDVRADLRWDGSIETLESGAVLVSNPVRGLWDAESGWQLQERFRLGTIDGEGPELFGELVAVELDESGRLFVLDRQAREVRLFDQEGRFVRSIGGPGEGPGEFSDPVGLGWGEEGELWVVDQGSGRYMAFDTSGTFLRQEVRQSSLFAPYWRGRIDHEGDLWEFAWVGVDRGMQQQAMIRAAPSGGSPDTVWIPRYDTEEYVLEREGEVFARRTVPFAPRAVWHMAQRDRIWWGVGASYRLIQLRGDVDTVRIVEREFEPVPVTEADVEDVLASPLYEQFERFGGTIDRSRIPPTKPAYERILEDDRGFLWVWPTGALEDRGRFLDVFDPEGRYLGRVEAPAPISPEVVDPPPLIRGERLVAIVRGELDVPQVLVARVEGR
jgi:hypothetical protein